MATQAGVSTQLLRQIPLFASLPENRLTELTRVLGRKSYPRGMTIIRAGGVSDSVHFVLSGSLKVTITGDDDGREVIVSTLGPGEYFGEMAAVDDSARSASVVSLGPCELLLLSKLNFRKYLPESLDLATTVMRSLVQRVHETSKKGSQRGMPIEPADTPELEFDPFLDQPEDELSGVSPVPPPEALRHSRIYNFHSRWDSTVIGTIELQPHWSVPWSDLMMVMMVMFAVMLVAKMAERDVGELFRKEAQIQREPRLEPQLAMQKIKQTEHAPISAEDILRLSEKLVTQANLEDIDVALTDNQAVKVSVRGNLLFDLGKADLKPDAVSFLGKLAQIIAANNYQIEVAGHTDNFPINNPAYPTNWELSSARAARVVRYLIQAGNLEPGRFAVVGHAFYRPTVPNTTPEAKARNRRVEIIITRNEYKP